MWSGSCCFVENPDELHWDPKHIFKREEYTNQQVNLQLLSNQSSPRILHKKLYFSVNRIFKEVAVIA